MPVCRADLPCWSAVVVVLVCRAGLPRWYAVLLWSASLLWFTVLVCPAGLPRWSAVLVFRVCTPHELMCQAVVSFLLLRARKISETAGASINIASSAPLLAGTFFCACALEVIRNIVGYCTRLLS